jgi:osmotically-inducible protein OsmY
MIERGAFMAAKMQPEESVDLRQLVFDQIRRNPTTKDSSVSVAAEGGIVRLTGTVKTKAESLAVETIAKGVPGVRAVANELQVRPSSEWGAADIAKEALKGIKGHLFLAGEDIRVIVRDGHVILEGTVRNELQKMLAEAQVKMLRGVFGVSNLLEVKPEAPVGEGREPGAVENADALSEAAWVETGEAEAG